MIGPPRPAPPLAGLRGHRLGRGVGAAARGGAAAGLAASRFRPRERAFAAVGFPDGDGDGAGSAGREGAGHRGARTPRGAGRSEGVLSRREEPGRPPLQSVQGAGAGLPWEGSPFRRN